MCLHIYEHLRLPICVCVCQSTQLAQASQRSMVKTCHKCGFESYGPCGKGCPKFLRLQSPKDDDFRPVCFKCYQMMAAKKTKQCHKSYLALHERLQQVRAQLKAATAASVPKKAKHSEDKDNCAAAASSTKRARQSEEPEAVCPSSSPSPSPEKKRRPVSLHQTLRSLSKKSVSKP